MLSYLRVQMEANQWEFAQLEQCGLPRLNPHGVAWNGWGCAPKQPQVRVGGLTSGGGDPIRTTTPNVMYRSVAIHNAKIQIHFA